MLDPRGFRTGVPRFLCWFPPPSFKTKKDPLLFKMNKKYMGVLTETQADSGSGAARDRSGSSGECDANGRGARWRWWGVPHDHAVRHGA